jgi:hypothetical protein
MTGLVQDDVRLPPIGLQSSHPSAINLAQSSELLETCLQHLSNELAGRGILQQVVEDVSHAVRHHGALTAASVRHL